jgi:hypothetical protein
MSNKTSKQKTAALAMVGVVVAAALVAAVSFSPVVALAQERGEVRDKIRDEVRDRVRDEVDQQHRFKVARGAGIATDTETGENFRTGLRVMTLYDNSTGERTAQRGAIVISVDGERIRYDMLPETWKIEVSEEGLTFEANGQVQNSEGEQFDVSLDGYFGIHGPRGGMWSVEGTLSGGELDYELHYVVLSHPRAPFVESEVQ